jgi:hypothetical protein
MARRALVLLLRVCSTPSGLGEDQSLIREGIVRMLEPAGFDVVGWAADARDVARKARVPSRRAVHTHRYPAAPGWMRSQEVFGLARGAVRRPLRRSLSLAARVRLTSASGTIRSRTPVLAHDAYAAKTMVGSPGCQRLLRRRRSGPAQAGGPGHQLRAGGVAGSGLGGRRTARTDDVL